MRGLRPLFPLAILLVLLAAAGAAAGGSTTHARDPIVSERVDIESWDGTVLAAMLWYNDTLVEDPRPVVLAAHGWGGHKGNLEGSARWLADRGYVVLAWDSRGFGESGGTVGLHGPDEWADVAALIDWLAARADGSPRILLDDAGDPRLGMIGGSYGGGIQLLAAAHDDRIDAIVPEVTWHSLVTSLAPNGVIKRGWVDLLYWAGQAASHGLPTMNPNLGGMDDRLTLWYTEAYATNRLPGEAREALLERSPQTHNPQVKAPALIMQGWRDTLFWPDEATRNHADLMARSDVDTHLVFHPGGHGHSLGDDDRKTVRGFTERFFARHLFQDTSAELLPPVIYHEATSGVWHNATAWPPLDSSSAAVPLRSLDEGDSAELLQAVAATSHTELQQFAGQVPLPHLDTAPGVTSILLATGMSGPLTLAGTPRVTLEVEPGVDDLILFLSLVESDGGHGKVLYNQVTPVRVDARAAERFTLDVELSSLAHTIPGGSTLYLRVATSDTGYLASREAGFVTLRLAESAIALPVMGDAGLSLQPYAPGAVAESSGSVPALVFLALAVLGGRAVRRIAS